MSNDVEAHGEARGELLADYAAGVLRALAASGVAVAQIPGQPAIARASYTVEPFAPAGAPITIPTFVCSAP